MYEAFEGEIYQRSGILFEEDAAETDTTARHDYMDYAITKDDDVEVHSVIKVTHKVMVHRSPSDPVDGGPCDLEQKGIDQATSSDVAAADISGNIPKVDGPMLDNPCPDEDPQVFAEAEQEIYQYQEEVLSEVTVNQQEVAYEMYGDVYVQDLDTDDNISIETSDFQTVASDPSAADDLKKFNDYDLKPGGESPEVVLSEYKSEVTSFRAVEAPVNNFTSMEEEECTEANTKCSEDHFDNETGSTDDQSRLSTTILDHCEKDDTAKDMDDDIATDVISRLPEMPSVDNCIQSSDDLVTDPFQYAETEATQDMTHEFRPGSNEVSTGAEADADQSDNQFGDQEDQPASSPAPQIIIGENSITQHTDIGQHDSIDSQTNMPSTSPLAEYSAITAAEPVVVPEKLIPNESDDNQMDDVFVAVDPTGPSPTVLITEPQSSPPKSWPTEGPTEVLNVTHDEEMRAKCLPKEIIEDHQMYEIKSEMCCLPTHCSENEFLDHQTKAIDGATAVNDPGKLEKEIPIEYSNTSIETHSDDALIPRNEDKDTSASPQLVEDKECTGEASIDIIEEESREDLALKSEECKSASFENLQENHANDKECF